MSGTGARLALVFSDPTLPFQTPRSTLRTSPCQSSQRNANSSQVGREELFEQDRQEPTPGWHCCVAVCGE
jgi:hypothetical protein